MVVIPIIAQDPISAGLLQCYKTLPALNNQTLLIIRPVPWPVNVRNTLGLVPIFELQRVLVDIYPVELGRLSADGAHEADWRRFLARWIVQVESRKRMPVAKTPTRRVRMVKVELMGHMRVSRRPRHGYRGGHGPFHCVRLLACHAPDFWLTIPCCSTL